MSTRRRLLPAFLLLAGFTASACTAILVPDESDDKVQRCDTSDDCRKLDDNRYVAQCIYGEGQPENSSKICAADFNTKVECGEKSYPETHPLSKAYAAAISAKAAYGQCATENRGKRGCPPMDGGVCNDGLTINNLSGTCDDPNDPIPAIYPPDAGGVESAGLDAADNFCRWYFCDESFVCDQSGSKPVCRPCSGRDPEDFGKGGCGTLYIQGEPSPMYTDPEAGNCNGSLDTTKAEFGSAPTP